MMRGGRGFRSEPFRPTGCNKSLTPATQEPKRFDSCCAACQHDTEYSECKLNWRRPIVGVYWKERNACSQFVRVEKGSGQ
jgi:hypothetical protein